MEKQTCELCGVSTHITYTITVEGSVLRVCKNCRKLGKEIKVRNDNKRQNKYRVERKTETFEDIIENYNEIISKAIKEKYGSLKIFAEKHNYALRYIQEIVRGDLKPTIQEARKLEKLLKVTLVEQITEDQPPISGEKEDDKITLGMLIKDERIKKIVESND